MALSPVGSRDETERYCTDQSHASTSSEAIKALREGAFLAVSRGPPGAPGAQSKCKPKTVPSGFYAVAASTERPCANHNIPGHDDDGPVLAAMRCDELLDAFDYEDARTYQAIKRG
jgi:hypothetical protein